MNEENLNSQQFSVISQMKPDKCSKDDKNELCVKNQNVEDKEPQLDKDAIATSNQATFSKYNIDNVDDENAAKIEFNCASCGLDEMVHYLGLIPPFANGITFREPTYIIRDPFQPPPPRGKGKAEYFVAIGADCNVCKKSFCKKTECSIFYTRTYCIRCAWDQLNTFPIEIQNKLRKYFC